MENFFTKAFENAPADAKESMYKDLILNNDSPYCTELRNQYYKKVLKSMGENVIIEKNVTIVNPQWVSLGDNVKLHQGVTIIARGEGGVTIGNNTRLKDRVFLDTESKETGYIEIENNVYLGTGTTLFGHTGLYIGAYSLIAQNVTCTPYSHIFDDPNSTIYGQGGHSQKVSIGPDAYIGMGVDIMHTGSVGKGSVVGAGSVIVKPIPPYSIAVGNPAKVIKERK
ncbi:MAG: hypothetical protein E7410_03975 [Ruminococcaceae bacterium]|nr:hypothetical protein [Oscillospiraceae bacterium]